MLKTKILNHLSLQRALALLGLGLLIAASLAFPVTAQTVTQGYNSDQPLQRGMIVKLQSDDPAKVEPVTNDTIEQMHGIVVAANDAPVTLSADDQKVFVATSGKFEVLVSDQNGTINTGDYVSISAVPGIGMKANEQQQTVAGKALGGFDGKSGVIGTMDIKGGDGSTRSTSIGRVSLDIVVARNPLMRASQANLPGFLQKATEAIAGKQVSPARVYLGLGVFFISALIAGSILFAGVRSSITAIGRNPLSRRINKSLIQVVLTSLIIFISGIFAVYLLLKL